MYIYIHRHTHIYIYIYINVNIYIYTYIYIIYEADHDKGGQLEKKIDTLLSDQRHAFLVIRA
jgi:hypothetical protein